jgi:hypothetical protein
MCLWLISYCSSKDPWFELPNGFMTYFRFMLQISMVSFELLTTMSLVMQSNGTFVNQQKLLRNGSKVEHLHFKNDIGYHWKIKTKKRPISFTPCTLSNKVIPKIMGLWGQGPIILGMPKPYIVTLHKNILLSPCANCDLNIYNYDSWQTRQQTINW